MWFTNSVAACLQLSRNSTSAFCATTATFSYFSTHSNTGASATFVSEPSR